MRFATCEADHLVILYGIRTLKQRVVAYRNDFCVSCESPRRAHRIRSIKFLHIFFIPVLPIGFWYQWKCSVCGRHPHHVQQATSGWKKVAVMLLGMVTAVVWVSPGSETGNSPLVTWLLRIVFTIVFPIALWFLFKPHSYVRLMDDLKKVEPAQEHLCPFCNASIVIDRGWRCSGCGVERTAVRGGIPSPDMAINSKAMGN